MAFEDGKVFIETRTIRRELIGPAVRELRSMMSTSDGADAFHAAAALCWLVDYAAANPSPGVDVPRLRAELHPVRVSVEEIVARAVADDDLSRDNLAVEIRDAICIALAGL